MALEYGPFNGLENAWDAYDFAEFFKLFFGNGVFPNPSNNLQVVTNANMQTKVSVGVGFVQGHKIKNTSDFILQHDIADGVLKRIDRVVMRANFLQNKGEIIVKKGTPASSPVAPTLVRNTDYYELALADVLINNGATVITQANITDQRLNTALCGVVATNITQLDTATLALQYQSAFEQMTVEQQQDFEIWFEGIRDTLDGDVAANLQNQISQTNNNLSQHSSRNASTTQSGHVQLNNTVSSTSTTQAATANAVKTAYDRAEQAFQTGNSRKQETVDALLQVDDSLPISPSSDWATVIGAIGNISTGKKWAKGVATSSAVTTNYEALTTTATRTGYAVTVTTLNFRPKTVIISNGENIAVVSEEFPDGASSGGYKTVLTGQLDNNARVKLKAPAILNDNGFSLPFNLANTQVTWIAFE